MERAEGYAVLTMADPDKLNVLSAALVVQLRRAAEELVGDSGVRAIVLTGEGKGFSTGGDLRLMKRATDHLADPEAEGGSSGTPSGWCGVSCGSRTACGRNR